MNKIPKSTYWTVDIENAKTHVGNGWSELLDRVYENKPTDAAITQVKEKFGGLRIYFAPHSELFSYFLDQIENESYTICEECGKSGKLREIGWMKTLCDICLMEYD